MLITARSESSLELVAISSEYPHELDVTVLFLSLLLAVAPDQMPSHMPGVAEGELRSERLWKICVV